jgi:NAD(P)H-quinone oxidoreductase subunit N
LRRLRAAGYRALLTSARGLGDPAAFLLELHGVRPPAPRAPERGARRSRG